MNDTIQALADAFEEIYLPLCSSEPFPIISDRSWSDRCRHSHPSDIHLHENTWITLLMADGEVFVSIAKMTIILTNSDMSLSLFRGWLKNKTSLKNIICKSRYAALSLFSTHVIDSATVTGWTHVCSILPLTLMKLLEFRSFLLFRNQ